jgi:hypothetical protein
MHRSYSQQQQDDARSRLRGGFFMHCLANTERERDAHGSFDGSSSGFLPAVWFGSGFFLTV